MLTDLQKSRTRLHLGYPDDQLHGPTLEIEQNLVLDRLNTNVELALRGDPATQTIEFQGEILCSPNSLLDFLEIALSRLGPTTVDDSLFVSQAGSVTLRRDELQARTKMYRSLQKQLASLLNVDLFDLTQNQGINNY